MSKRNSVTTSAKRQMQNATPHVRWSSNEAQRVWQMIVNELGAGNEEAQAAFDVGIVAGVPKHVLKQPKRQQPVPTKRQQYEDVFYRDFAAFFDSKRRVQAVRA